MTAPPSPGVRKRRAYLRADLDAFYARAYGLTRDELRYILDPTDVKGPDYPSETFRVLKEKEVRQYGESPAPTASSSPRGTGWRQVANSQNSICDPKYLKASSSLRNAGRPLGRTAIAAL